jgi:Fe-S cluster biogenesis protein NfuA
MKFSGNVKLTDIDGPVVKLELEGACGTCPSSSMTMKMGLERKLKERIPEIAEVIQVLPNAPVLSSEGVETVLDGVRPFLSIAGGKISLVEIRGMGGLQPTIALKMEGSSAALQSVKLEIMQRIQRHFMTSLRIDWQ